MLLCSGFCNIQAHSVMAAGAPALVTHIELGCGFFQLRRGEAAARICNCEMNMVCFSPDK
ncbi:hypothetical protein D3C74_493450 [compost metagenome]